MYFHILFHLRLSNLSATVIYVPYYLEKGFSYICMSFELDLVQFVMRYDSEKNHSKSEKKEESYSIQIRIQRICSGTEGFEPPNSGTKTRCLTTWLRPIYIFIGH